MEGSIFVLGLREVLDHMKGCLDCFSGFLCLLFNLGGFGLTFDPAFSFLVNDI